MKNIVFLVSILFISFQLSHAQSKEKHFCGTRPEKSEWLKKYQKNPSAYRFSAKEKLYVPLTMHILGTDSGSGHYPIIKLNKALCTLNKDFADANIIFYIKGDIDYINNDTLLKHQNIKTGGKMMLANNIEGTINCYIVKDPAGNCGYSLPYGGVALAISCIDPQDHTWSHEIGHYCSLPHPFLGWEGGVSWDNSIQPNYKKPAPEFVLYDYTDFKDQLFEQDTLIIDTALVEKVDGSNCLIAADGFCDTKPDYINFRWPCDANQESTDQIDPNGIKFRSDGTLIMSYASDDCSYRFTPDQIAAMRANVMDVKKYFSLEGEIETKNFEETATLVSPIEEITLPYKNIHLEWSPITNAEKYVIYVSRYKNFSNLSVNMTTTNPYVDIEKLKKNKTYYWKVYAYSNFAFCNHFSDAAIFNTSESTPTVDLNSFTSFSIYPRLIKNNQDINIQLDSKTNTSVDIEIHNTSGIQLINQYNNISVGHNRWKINTQNLVSGLYFLTIKTNTGILTQKFMVQ